MKKMVAAIMAAFLLFLCVGCFKTEDDYLAEQSADASTIQPDDYHSVGETISTATFDFAVRSIKYYLQDGAYFVIADVTYTNKSVEKIRLESSSIACYLDNEMAQQVSYPDTDYVDTNQMLNSSSINPGRTKSGLLFFVIYRPWNDIEIQCEDVIVKSNLMACENITMDTEPSDNQSDDEHALQSDSNDEPMFIIDTSTGTFHRPDCVQINLIGAAHRAESHNTAEVLISGGARPCEVCRPDQPE